MVFWFFFFVFILVFMLFFFFFQAEDGIRDYKVTGVQTCALPIYGRWRVRAVHHTTCAVRDKPIASMATVDWNSQGRPRSRRTALSMIRTTRSRHAAVIH